VVKHLANFNPKYEISSGQDLIQVYVQVVFVGKMK
jgi:hypothetical protein